MLEAFRCSLCDEMFCLTHRNPEEHQCVELQKREGKRQQQQAKHIAMIQGLVPSLQTGVTPSTSEQQGSRQATGHSVSSTLPPCPSTQKAQKATMLERIKLRQKCTGDTSIPVYNRLHVQVTLGPGLRRYDASTAANKLPVLPSQRRGTSYNTVDPTVIHTWLDKTRSIGWHVDFLEQHFRVRSDNNDNNNSSALNEKLYLCRREAGGGGLQPMAYSADAGSVVEDGEQNLCLMYLELASSKDET